MDRAPDLRLFDLAQARRLLEASLFDSAFYRGEAALKREDDAFAHYFGQGARAGLRPNAVFDPRWYVAENPDAAGVDPLLHYAVIGEPSARDPSPLFDVAWYRRTYAAERPLAHYLAHRFGPFSPVPEFDAEFYLKTYPDVGAARLDPFQHYLHFGFREFRRPRAGFNPRLYALRFLRDDRGANPVVHMRTHPAAAPQARRPGPYADARRFTRRGPRFEALAPPVVGQAPRALVLAYHLTQFHRIPENDAWWGEGYTEWTQLARGQPRFAGHYQPRIPGELGFYDLTNPAVLRAQTALAKAAGVGGFVFYYYDFGGRRLLEKPLELFLAAPDIDIGFCLMWANENWTRRWDGAEADVLIAQDYDERHEVRRCTEFARHFRDPRYIRLDGRPLLMVYRASPIPDTAATLARWRRLFAERFQENPVFVMAQCFADVDPRPLGFDAAVEFPPHKLTKGLPQIYDGLNIHDEAFEADAFAYDDLVDASLGEPSPDFPLIKTVVPSWDNDARRQGQGLTLVGSTPVKYERWLGELIARATPAFGARIVCVNAWNEWSEGAYLEPDVHFGAAYLNATARAVYGVEPQKARLTVLGDVSPLLDVQRRLAAAFGFAVASVATAAQARGADAALARDRADIFALAEAGLRAAWLPEAPPQPGESLPPAAAILVAAAADDSASVIGDPALAADEAEADRRLRVLFSRLWPQTAKVSVFLRHRGGSAFSPLRLRSIWAQTHPVWEVVVLDAAEASLDVVDAEARAADRDVTVGLDVADPWRRAAEMASGDFVWIVEAQGRSDPTCLAALVAPLVADAQAAFSFCDSRQADADGRPLYARPTPLAAPKRLASFVDRSFTGAEFIALLDDAPPPDPSAILWRRDALSRALAASPDADVDAARLARQAAAAPAARVFHVADMLNFAAMPGPG